MNKKISEMSRQTRTFVLLGSEERVWSEFDREDRTIGHRAATVHDVPQKVLISETVTPFNELTPADVFPIGIVYDHADVSDESSEQVHTYGVPLFSHDVARQLEGRLLDYVDATYADKDQRDAQKRVIRSVLWGFHKDLVSQRGELFKHAKLSK